AFTVPDAPREDRQPRGLRARCIDVAINRKLARGPSAVLEITSAQGCRDCGCRLLASCRSRERDCAARVPDESLERGGAHVPTCVDRFGKRGCIERELRPTKRRTRVANDPAARLALDRAAPAKRFAPEGPMHVGERKRERRV